jgi:hypothetical protein
MRSLGFLLVCFVAQTILRKVGWAMCRAFTYGESTPVCVLFLIIWGIAIAFGYRYLVLLLHPGWIVKIIGYGSAAYVSIPNYGLIAEHTIPSDKVARHSLISNLPLVVFIACSILFAFTIGRHVS